MPELKDITQDSARIERFKPSYEVLKRLLSEKKPAYHDCVDDGEEECAWCEAERIVRFIDEN